MGQPTSVTIIFIYLHCCITFYIYYVHECIIIIDNSISTYDHHSFITFYVYYDYGCIIDSSCLLSSLPPFSFSLLFSSFVINLVSAMAT